jgi:putative flippase GtrA
VGRFLRFNLVGLAGFAIQLSIVFVGSGFSRTLITALAVEAALLHNFIWHERWTWADRRSSGRGRLRRLARFHLSNGLVSLVGNVAIVTALGNVPAVAANAIAVVVCSLINFAAGNQWVFRMALPAERSSPTYP